MDDNDLLAAALEQAEIGHAEGGIPVGAAIAVDGQLLAVGRNRHFQLGSVIRHAETDALENAGRQPTSVYVRATLATTYSPCAMCTGAILLCGIPRVVIGERTTSLGNEELLQASGVEIVHLDSEECRQLMETFTAEFPDFYK
jgi:cytosine deaminase